MVEARSSAPPRPLWPAPHAPRALANNLLDKLGLEKPEDVAKLVQEKVGDLDLDSAKAFGSKNLDVLKDNQERALIDVAAAAFCGLLFAGVYGAVGLRAGLVAAAPDGRLFQTGGPYGALHRDGAAGRGGRRARGHAPDVQDLFHPDDGFAVLISVVVISARARQLYLDTKPTPSASICSPSTSSLKWPRARVPSRDCLLNF